MFKYLVPTRRDDLKGVKDCGFVEWSVLLVVGFRFQKTFLVWFIISASWFLIMMWVLSCLLPLPSWTLTAETVSKIKLSFIRCLGHGVLSQHRKVTKTCSLFIVSGNASTNTPRHVLYWPLRHFSIQLTQQRVLHYNPLFHWQFRLCYIPGTLWKGNGGRKAALFPFFPVSLSCETCYWKFL